MTFCRIGLYNFKMKRSRQFEIAIENLLNKINVKYIHLSYRCYRCGTIINAAAKGFPDFECYLKGKILYIECKTGSGKLTKAQKTYRDLLINSGADYLELHDNVDDLMQYFEKEKKRK